MTVLDAYNVAIIAITVGFVVWHAYSPPKVESSDEKKESA